ncbi:MAG: 2-oxoglutarate dehydrogenase complex dihydrolipoyllysine-residue succinyltransferase [Thermoanaerobaculales bacterium]|jgi:2-oxoglutarate dehydrogenase E2 component (dihydrolipoamide succinyltransferase)|nr:2-oxoglutarate dehydrogenase complex dihydrolipoyllysine-residue succinyltransferase [Thermoanaerobaculales bacterium]
MAFEVRIPEVGESVSEGVLVEWTAADGAVVAVDEPLLVLETDKITMNVTAERAGRLQIQVGAGATVRVGQVVASIAEEGDGARPAAALRPAAAGAPEAAPEPTAAGGDEDHGRLTPAVRRLVHEHDLDPARIEGTGRDGRILKGDVLRHLEARQSSATAAEAPARPATGPAKAEPPHAPARTAATTAAAGERQTRAPMSRLRQRLAERLVEVQRTAAILTTFNEADMSRVMALRSAHKEDFAKRHGIGLGFMSFFVKAAVDALRTVPEVNAYIDGTEVVTNHYFDIGVAVSTDKGLVVPVVRDADRLSMAEIEAAIADLAGRAQERRLELSDLTGAVFTISNGGVFGSLLSTPILNPPGSAILGMHAVQRRPVAIGDEIAIRPMMYLALSYDHRIIDGREAVSFLKRIKDCIESPERMLLEV